MEGEEPMTLPNEFSDAFIRDLKRIRGVKGVTLHDHEEESILTIMIRCSWLHLTFKWLALRLHKRIQEFLNQSPFMRISAEDRDIRIFPYHGAPL